MYQPTRHKSQDEKRATLIRGRLDAVVKASVRLFFSD